MDGSLSDLLRDYKLRTRFEKPHIIHVFDDPDAPPSSPPRLEHWKKSRTLGHGGQGRVVLQTCISGSRGYTQRAVKMIPLQEDGRRPYLRELEAIIKFSHDKYAKYFAKTTGWYTSHRTLYIAMEYFPAGDLQTYAMKYAPLPENECQEITSQILRGLATMHQESFAHRDVKPQNVLIHQCPQSDPPASWWVKLADFGISKRLEAGTSGSTRKIGTLQYMAPELLRSGLSVGSNFSYPAVDMWALGVTAFMLLTKTLPFQDVSSAIDYASDPNSLFAGAVLNDFQASADAQAFISALMRPRPTERLDSDAAMSHVWIHSGLPDIQTPVAYSGSSDSSSRSSSFDEGTGDAFSVINLSSQPYSKSWSNGSIEHAQSPSEAYDPIWDEKEPTDGHGPRDNADKNSITRYWHNETSIMAQYGTQNDENETSRASYDLLTEQVVNLKTTEYNKATRFLVAAFEGAVATVKHLIESGIDLEATDPEGSTALSKAASRDHEDVVEFLAVRGANIEHKDKQGIAALSMATSRGNQSMVRLLIKAGANIETRSNRGNTPLMFASSNGDKGMVKLLLDKGANIETKNNLGFSALILATAKGREAMVKFLLERGANIETESHEGETPLLVAASFGYSDVVKLLARNRAKLHVRNNNKETPLHRAAAGGHTAITTCLLDRGAEIEARDDMEYTPLARAVFMGKEATVRRLMDFNANIEARNRWGETPLWIANYEGLLLISNLLLKNGAKRETAECYEPVSRP